MSVMFSVKNLFSRINCKKYLPSQLSIRNLTKYVLKSGVMGQILFAKGVEGIKKHQFLFISWISWNSSCVCGIYAYLITYALFMVSLILLNMFHFTVIQVYKRGHVGHIPDKGVWKILPYRCSALDHLEVHSSLHWANKNNVWNTFYHFVQDIH